MLVTIAQGLDRKAPGPLIVVYDFKHVLATLPFPSEIIRALLGKHSDLYNGPIIKTETKLSNSRNEGIAAVFNNQLFQGIMEPF
jgi:hypothetical protein